jgi:hypothetical protein
MGRNSYYVDGNVWPRGAVTQYTSCELRQVVRDRRGLALLTRDKARDYRTMAYGVLLERRRSGHDGHKRLR